MGRLHSFTDELRTLGWTQEERSEHRWRGPNGSIMDLLPAGPKLRQARRIIWPKSDFEMSLVGFEHVFVRALSFTFAEGIQYRVVPPPVIALLKIIAFMDDPHRRRKDLLDIGELFRHYERASDRMFSDEVFAAGLDDIEYATAYEAHQLTTRGCIDAGGSIDAWLRWIHWYANHLEPITQPNGPED
jgi:predicted nucleotidyltransferase